MNERVGAAAVINRHFLDGETTCHHLPKRLPANSTIFAAEGYSHHHCTELLPVHGPSSPRCGGLIWLNVLLACDRGRRHWEPFYLPYHEPPLVIEWQRHTCSFRLDTEPLWHRGKWKSRPASKRDPWPQHRSTSNCLPCRFEAIGQLLYPAAGSNQVGSGCT